jgi:hypothetical protein
VYPNCAGDLSGDVAVVPHVVKNFRQTAAWNSTFSPSILPGKTVRLFVVPLSFSYCELCEEASFLYKAFFLFEI